MMNSFPDDIEAMRLATREVVAKLLVHDSEFQRTNVVPAAVEAALRELGAYGLRIPVQFGGTEQGMLATVAVVSELGRLPPQFWSFLRVALGPSSKALVMHGTPAQQAKWLPAIAAGRCGVAFVLTEPDAGSDLSALRTRATATPGGYVLNGAKTYISNADRAHLFLMFARTGGAGQLKGGLSTFLVEPNQRGVHISPPMPTMGTTLDGLFEVSFNDCFVPADGLLGVEGEGFNYAMESLNEGRLNVGAMAIAMGRYALELALDHVKTRMAFGKAIAANQAVQHMLANAAMELHAGWLMLLDAARRVDAGADAAASSAMVKIYCSEAAGRAVDMAVQLFGAAGYLRGMPVERLYRDVRVLRIYEGASEVLRNVVAKSVLATGFMVE